MPESLPSVRHRVLVVLLALQGESKPQDAVRGDSAMEIRWTHVEVTREGEWRVCDTSRPVRFLTQQ